MVEKLERTRKMTKSEEILQSLKEMAIQILNDKFAEIETLSISDTRKIQKASELVDEINDYYVGGHYE